MHFYPTDKASLLTSVTLRQLQYWRERDIVVPVIDEAGRGRSVYYSYENLLELMVFRYLLRQDITFIRARRTLEDIRRWGEGSLGKTGVNRFLLTRVEGDSSLRVVPWTEYSLEAAIRGERLIVFISLEGLEHALRTRMAKYKLDMPPAIFLFS